MGTGIPLIDQIRNALSEDLYPIFVSEGQSDEKLNRIRHNDYLARAYRSFQSTKNPLFIYGHSMAENDWHIMRLIGEGRIQKLFVSIYGDEDSDENLQIKERVEKIHELRSRNRGGRVKELEVRYLSSFSGSGQESACWG